MLFHSAAAGISFLVLAFVITRLLIARWPDLHAWWRGLVPFAYTGTSLLAFMMGSLGWLPLNVLSSREEHAEKAIEEWGDFLEILLNECMRETRHVSLTLTNGKGLHRLRHEQLRSFLRAEVHADHAHLEWIPLTTTPTSTNA